MELRNFRRGGHLYSVGWPSPAAVWMPLWPPCVVDADIIFLSCFFLSICFFFVGLYVREWGTYRPSEKLVKAQCLPHMPHNTTANFNGFRFLTTLLHGTILHHGDELTVQFLQHAQCSHCKRCISYGNSVRLSVTHRYCVKTTARSTVQFALSDSKMCLVL